MRRLRQTAVSVPALLIAACARPGVPSPEGLAYGIPDPNPAVYEFADTARFAIETGAMGTMEVVAGREGVAELDFRRDDDAFHVTIRFPRLRGSFDNAMQGSVRADETDLHGPVGARVSYRGRVEVVDTPSLSRNLLDVGAGPEALARPLFAHLPGRPVEPGASWVDTVTTVGDDGATRSRAWSIITSTLAGDTVVAGRRLLLIHTDAATSLDVEGVSGGVEIAQHLTGRMRGHVLWDDRARLLVEREEAGELSGSLDLPGMGAGGLPVYATVVRRVSLRR
jgi:hypothetical protein